MLYDRDILYAHNLLLRRISIRCSDCKGELRCGQASLELRGVMHFHVLGAPAPSASVGASSRWCCG